MDTTRTSKQRLIQTFHIVKHLGSSAGSEAVSLALVTNPTTIIRTTHQKPKSHHQTRVITLTDMDAVAGAGNKDTPHLLFLLRILGIESGLSKKNSKSSIILYQSVLVPDLRMLCPNSTMRTWIKEGHDQKGASDWLSAHQLFTKKG